MVELMISGFKSILQELILKLCETFKFLQVLTTI